MKTKSTPEKWLPFRGRIPSELFRKLDHDFLSVRYVLARSNIPKAKARKDVETLKHWFGIKSSSSCCLYKDGFPSETYPNSFDPSLCPLRFVNIFEILHYRVSECFVIANFPLARASSLRIKNSDFSGESNMSKLNSYYPRFPLLRSFFSFSLFGTRCFLVMSGCRFFAFKPIHWARSFNIQGCV